MFCLSARERVIGILSKVDSVSRLPGEWATARKISRSLTTEPITRAYQTKAITEKAIMLVAVWAIKLGTILPLLSFSFR